MTPDQQIQTLTQLATDWACTLDEARARLAFTWEGWLARPSQLEPEGAWLFWLVKCGRGFGKTRIGAEWTRRQVRRFGRVALMGQDVGSVRAEMIEGESGILAVCPSHERPVHRPSKRQLEWPNGAISEIRTGEDPEGVRGLQCERLWADELAAWQYPQESWDMAMFGLRLGEDPRALITSTPKPIGIMRTLVNDPDCVVTSGSTYENLGNLGPTYRAIIDRYEGTRLGRQELHAELLDDEGLAYRWSEKIHVVERFEVPAEWERFEHMDYGLSAPTAWYATAVDYDGNLIIFDGLYEPGLPSELAPKIRLRRELGWEAKDPATGARERNVCWADPAVFAAGARTKFGRPASVADEFQSDCGIALAAANNDRRAGFVRVSELLKLDPARRFPRYHVLGGDPDAPVLGAPRLYVMDVPGTLELRQQLADAPLEEDGKPLPGEAVDRDWERAKGHGHASLRYGVMSRPSPSTQQPQPLADPRAELLRQVREKRDKSRPANRRRYVA